MNLFIAKLSPNTTSDDLQDLFGEFGEVVSAKVIIDRITGHSKKFGFVEMKNVDDGNKAIKELNECEFDGSDIVVKKARPKNDNYQKRPSFGYNERY